MTFNDAVPVVIPCYNEERFILKALKQLVDQCDRDRYEIIIADGLSAVREGRWARPAGDGKTPRCILCRRADQHASQLRFFLLDSYEQSTKLKLILS